MWTVFMRGIDVNGEDDYYALVGTFSSYKEAWRWINANPNWEQYLNEKYGFVQYDELEVMAMQVYTNFCETIYCIKEE